MPRTYGKILKTARTIADLAGAVADSVGTSGRGFCIPESRQELPGGGTENA